MNQTAPLGMNRTGMQTSPMDAKRLLQATQEFEPDTAAEDLEEVRMMMVEEAEPIGSVPPPATMKGMATAGMQMMAGHKAHAMLDKLAERLAFERSGTRLYEAFCTKCEANADDLGVIDLETLRHFRDEEASHVRLLDVAIRSIGGDPTAQTPCADLTGVENMGLMQVVTDPRTSVTQSLHAVFVAELADEPAWDLLASTAEEMGQKELAARFRTALAEERTHLETVRMWYEAMTRSVLGLAA
jgi:rubrerythrin